MSSAKFALAGSTVTAVALPTELLQAMAVIPSATASPPGSTHQYIATTTLIGNGDILVGADKFRTRYFEGLIDDLILYNRALSPLTIHGVANPLDTGIANAQIRFRHARDADQGENDGTWFDLALDSPGENYSTWQHTFPTDLEGPYKIVDPAVKKLVEGIANVVKLFATTALK